MRAMPLWELNPAESIFAPFHDDAVVPQLPVVAAAAAATGFWQGAIWDSTRVQWDRCPAGAAAGSLTLTMGALPARFDHYIFCLVLPPGMRAQFAAYIGGEWFALGAPAEGSGARLEVTRPIAAPASALRVTFTAAENGAAMVSLHWWGAGDATLLAGLQAARPRYDAEWAGLILPDEAWPKVRFARGLLFAEDDLPALRARAAHPGWQAHFAMLDEQAREALAHRPEEGIGDYLPWSDYRYLRERERGQEPWMAAPVHCALVGLVRGDRALMRQALRFLMCFVHTRHWCQSAESRARGSVWDQRCFLEEMAVTTCALVYDLLYFALTDRARELVRMAIWDKGLSIIQRDMVKWEYIYRINQGPWFCRARLLGGLVLEPAWPRTRPYVEQAYADLQEGMANYLLPDGGVDEGVGYFSVTLQAVLPGLMAYARARGRAIRDVLPPRLARSGNFVAVMSAMSPGGVLMDGDNSNERFTGDAIALLAAFYPDDIYRRIAAGTRLQARGATYFRQYLVDGPFAFIGAPLDLPVPECIVPEFGRLPATGAITSRRAVAPGREVRLHLSGCKARASHTHFDKGAFTLELGQTPVLIDRGVVRYDDSRHLLLKRTELHNVLTPLDRDDNPCGQAGPEIAVIPEGAGDARQFHAAIDLSHVWREVMRRSGREIHSDVPSAFTVRDHGELIEPRSLAFNLQTRRPWLIDPAARRAELVLPDWRLVLHAPWADTLSQAEDGIDHRLEPVWRLICRVGARREFDLVTAFECVPL
ncbi:MAG: hypothetical protein ACHQ4G_00890 [Opitutales bacterium]